jgi:predicted MFS family arabinose efflux permease
MAQSFLMLFAGSILTGISPGFVFAPLADAITASFEPERRGPAFAVINAGEGAGAIAAGLLFYAAADWRLAWLAFCGLAVVSTIAVAGTIPSGSVETEEPRASRPSWLSLLERQAWPLLCGALIIGVSTTVLWTYAGVLLDGVRVQGVELRVALWVVMGASGVAAIAVAPILEAFGLRRVYAASVVLTSVSAVALALVANDPAMALIAGAVFGFAYIMVTSQIGAWAIAIWPRMPAAGFGFTFLVFSTGAVIGPALAGMASAFVSMPAILAAMGVLTAFLLPLLPPRN